MMMTLSMALVQRHRQDRTAARHRCCWGVGEALFNIHDLQSETLKATGICGLRGEQHWKVATNEERQRGHARWQLHSFSNDVVACGAASALLTACPILCIEQCAQQDCKRKYQQPGGFYYWLIYQDRVVGTQLV